jgi:YHS domain-containing protein
MRIGQKAGTLAVRVSAHLRRAKKMAKDPVCGMQVDEKKAAATSVYHGTTYYFCAIACKITFDKSPEKYLGKGEGHAPHH